MAQELKSNLQSDINDTLMHYLETSTVWLYIARSAFTDGFLPTVQSCIGALQGLWGHWGALTKLVWCQTADNVRLDPSSGLFTYLSPTKGTAPLYAP